jgi:hypothetical protein
MGITGTGSAGFGTAFDRNLSRCGFEPRRFRFEGGGGGSWRFETGGG